MIGAIYARKSTEQNGVEDQERSVTRQIEHGKAYAVKKGWTVTEEHVYLDDGISGAEFQNRPGFLRLMNALKPKAPFQVLIMSEESRLGRESIETAYALKQLVTAGVRVWFYLEDRERTLDTPTDKVLLSLTTFADELERDKARQRTHDAMLRKAKRGEVTGGRVFGYDNRRSEGHVERVINETEAEVVREIFKLCAQGKGFRAIAFHLNAIGAPAPLPRRANRPRGWAPSSVREVLYRDLYRGVIVWNRTKKRNQWGEKRQSDRPETDWIRLEVPDLRIVPEESWQAAHERLSGSRAVYLRHTDGTLWGRPTNGIDSRYLLSGMLQCGCCGQGMIVSHSKRHPHTYKCATNHQRGKAICANGLTAPMPLTNKAVLSTLEQDVLHPQVVERAIQIAIERLEPSQEGRQDTLRAQLKKVQGEIDNLAAAIAQGGQLPSLLQGVKEREKRRDYLQRELDAAEGLRKITRLDLPRIQRDLRDRLTDWQGLLNRHPAQSRQILRKLLVGRLIFEPQEDGSYVFKGEASVGRILEGTVARAMVAPAGFEPAFPP